MDDEGAVLIFIVIVAVGLVAAIFFLLTLQNCLKKIKMENREMSPGLVWLNLIPIFSLGWTFYIVAKLSNSIKKELGSAAEDGGWGLGLAYAILQVTTLIPGIGAFLSIPLIIVWIIYWVKISKYSKQIESTGAIVT